VLVDLVCGSGSVGEEQEVSARPVGKEIEETKDSGGSVRTGTLFCRVRPSGQLNDKTDEVQ